MIKKVNLMVIFAALLLGVITISGCMGGNNSVQQGVSAEIYPGSQSYNFPATYYTILNIPSEGITVKAYRVSNVDIEDILNWYESKMNSSGWIFQEKYPVTTITTPSGSISFGGVLFKKGDTGEGIWAWQQLSSGSSETFYVIATGPWSKFSETAEADQLPDSDQVEGEEPIQRYPGSVMTSYEKDTSEPTRQKIYIDYGTNDNASTVADWYRQYLQGEGWNLDEDSSDDTGYSLSFSRGAENLEISIFKPSETTAYTEIDIYYSKTQLPDTDQTTGYEPATRYPGSVMLNYQNISYGGFTLIAITYGTTSDVNDVVNWYTSNMPSEGWTVTSTGGSPDDQMIFFSKGSSSLSVEVNQQPAYTEINIQYSSS